MRNEARYPIPARRHRTEQTIRRSRFITTLAPASTGDAAEAVVDGIREEFPDATHNCWAFVLGPPGSTAQVGMSDDGEPHGTAGRPMLEALLHSGVGEIVAVVTRYYGGIKLGKGGLGRAYSGGVSAALESLPRTQRVSRVALDVSVAYAAHEPVRRLAEELDAVVESEEFGADVRLRLAVPDDVLDRFRRGVAEVTGGQAAVEPSEPG